MGQAKSHLFVKNIPRRRGKTVAPELIKRSHNMCNAVLGNRQAIRTPSNADTSLN
jgi:hypothetical protein